MKAGIFYHKRTGAPVQIIARAQTKPTFQEVICYQELTRPYEHYVMEKRQFFAEFVKEFEELPLTGRKQIAKRQDLPDKQPRISKGVVEDPQQETDPEEEPMDPRLQGMIAFFDAASYHEKLKLFEKIKDDLDEHMLNNIAVSLDLSLEEGADACQMIMSELRIKSKYETKRGDRL